MEQRGIMGQALYRKYRSRSLDEIVGQKPVTTALENAIKSGNVSHAYLFTGPRGTGKTSIARILAFKINDIPYDSDSLPLDIIEIDAASNRRIDEIRDLRDKVNIAPVNAKYKVYIIDEVHMLTREAFNALLKTLEEPPAHVIFILATTEAHKLPETIISRTQRYTFKLATQSEVAEHLKNISNKENIKIDDEALKLLAKHSGGSMRDALSLLDQVRHSTNNITAETIRLNLGLPSDDLVISLLDAINSGEPSKIMTALESAKTDGASASLIAEQIISSLRDQIAAGKKVLSSSSLELMQNLLLVESSSRPDIQLELALIGAQLAQNPQINHTTVSAAKISAPSPAFTAEIPKPATKQITKKPEAQAELKPDTVRQQTDVSIVAEAQARQFSEEAWNLTLETLRQDHSTLYSILRMAKPSYDDADNMQIRLLFKFPFHQKRISEAHNKQCVLECLATNGVNGYEIICDIMPKDQADQILDPIASLNTANISSQPENGVVSQIRNVFGGAEVLE